MTENEFLLSQKGILDLLVAELSERIGLDLTYRTELTFTTELRDAVAKMVQNFRDRRSDIAGTPRTAGSQPTAGTPSNPIRNEGAYLTAIRSSLTTIQSSLATRLAGDNTNRTEDQYLAALITSLNSANGSLNTRLVELATAGYAGSISYTAAGVKHVPGTEPKWLDKVSVFDPFSGTGRRLAEYEAWLGRSMAWIVDNCFEGRTRTSPMPGTNVPTTPGSDWPEITTSVQNTVWAYRPITRNLMLSVPVVPMSYKDMTDRFDMVTSGAWDEHYTKTARSMIECIDKPLADGRVRKFRIRLWEWNGSWMAAYAGNTADLQAKARAAADYFIDFFKAIDPRFEFDFCPTVGVMQANSFNIAPTLSKLKSWGTDVYDQAWLPAHRVTTSMSQEEKEAVWNARFNDTVLNGPQGLIAHANFAAAAGLERTFPEWACRNRAANDSPQASGGDNPVFIQRMRDHFRDLENGVYPGTRLGLAAYFERQINVYSALSHGIDVSPATNPRTYHPTDFPNAAAKYLELFGAAASA